MEIAKFDLLKPTKQLADFFTKPLARDKFNFFRTGLSILDASNVFQ